MSLRRFIARRRYAHRANTIGYWSRVFGLDFAAEYAIGRGWISRDLWERERRLQLVRVWGDPS